jgi:hypothetical protein
MRVKESAPAYRAALLYHQANASAREAILCRQRGEGALAHLHNLNARGQRELARGLLEKTNG